MRSISSRQNPVVRAFRRIAESPPPDGSRILLDGPHLVEEARAAGLAFEHVAVAAAHLEARSDLGTLASALDGNGVDVLAVTAPVMAAMSPVRSPSGLVAIVSRPPSDLGAILGHPAALVVAAVDVQDPGNIGALLRAAEAGGASGALICGASASPFAWKAVRGSMGSVLRLPVVARVDVDLVMERARACGVRSVASVARSGAAPDAMNWRAPTVLFVGGEGGGLSSATAAACDARVTVPMEPPVESLNVAVAAALLVYEARRQRRRAS